jgi:hypothetical protein
MADGLCGWFWWRRTKQLKSHVRSQLVCHWFRLFRPATKGMALHLAAMAAASLTKSNGTLLMRSTRERRRESLLGWTTAQSSAPPGPRRNEETRPDMVSDEKASEVSAFGRSRRSNGRVNQEDDDDKWRNHPIMVSGHFLPNREANDRRGESLFKLW